MVITAPVEPEKTFAGHWVLLVERDVQGLVAETRLLESFGMGVQTAADVDEALETLREEPGCSLVLLATLMSERNTCDTIMEIRGDEQFGALPLVIIGSSADEAAQARYLEAGADGFLTKPVERAGLEGMLKALLRDDGGVEQRQRQTA